jgi:hypothetical protein
MVVVSSWLNVSLRLLLGANAGELLGILGIMEGSGSMRE